MHPQHPLSLLKITPLMSLVSCFCQSTIRTQHERNGNGFQDGIVFACLSRPITQMYLDELVETPVNAREGVSRRLGQVEIP